MVIANGNFTAEFLSERILQILNLRHLPAYLFQHPV